jgi:hypothetical protein
MIEPEIKRGASPITKSGIKRSTSATVIKQKLFFIMSAFVFFGISACTYSSVKKIDLVRSKASQESRETHRQLELFLEKKGFKREHLKDGSSRTDNSKWISTYYLDPVAPNEVGLTWFLTLRTDVETNSLTLIVMQLNAKPTTHMLARAEQILIAVRELMPEARFSDSQR